MKSKEKDDTISHKSCSSIAKVKIELWSSPQFYLLNNLS